MNRNIRRMEAVMAQIAKNTTLEQALAAIAECKSIVAAMKQKRRRIKQALPGMSRKAAKGHRDERKAQHHQSVMVEVMKRDGGMCVVCGEPANDMHHLVYGSGMRSVAETGKTCASVCRFHHRKAHSGDVRTLEALHLWSNANGYDLARKAISRRLEKIEARVEGRPTRERPAVPGEEKP